MFSHILVTGSRNRTNLIGQFFFWLVYFFFKKIATENSFSLSGLRSRWPGLLLCCMRKLCAHLRIVCVVVCFYFMRLFCFWLLFSSGANTSFIGVTITKLVVQFFLLSYFCIFRHVVISVLHNCVFVYLLVFLLVDIICIFVCLRYFLQSVYAVLDCFFWHITHVCNCLMFAGCWRYHFLVLGSLRSFQICFFRYTNFAWYILRSH